MGAVYCGLEWDGERASGELLRVVRLQCASGGEGGGEVRQRCRAGDGTAESGANVLHDRILHVKSGAAGNSHGGS